SKPRNFTDVNGTVFFTATDGAGDTLWKSDGTEAGTVPVSNVFSPGNLTNVDGTLFFTANDGVHGNELWKSDGTAGGTTLGKNINPGFDKIYDYYGGYTLFPSNSNPAFLTAVNGKLYFTAFDGSHRSLWTSDGTDAGTTTVGAPTAENIIPYNYGLTEMNGTLFFTSSDGVSGNELWKSDGTAAGTGMVKDARPGSIGSYPSNLTNVNGKLYFRAYDDAHGSELWKSDGTATGTALVKDIFPGGYFGSYGSYNLNSSSPSSLTNVNGILLFTA